MIRTEPYELVQSDGLWHRIAWHTFEYATATNHNATDCGLALMDPPYKAWHLFVSGWQDDRCRPCNLAYVVGLRAAADEAERRA